MTNDQLKQALDKIKEYGRAAHDAGKNGDRAGSDHLHQKAEQELADLYKALGLGE